MWRFVHRIQIPGGGGISEGKALKDEDILRDEFANFMSRKAKRLCEVDGNRHLLSAHHDGILILMDEVDNAPDPLDLGTFLKLFLERIHDQPGGRKVIVVLAGLPIMQDVLRKSHKSSLRIFRDGNPDAWQPAAEYHFQAALVFQQ